MIYIAHSQHVGEQMVYQNLDRHTRGAPVGPHGRAQYVLAALALLLWTTQVLAEPQKRGEFNDWVLVCDQSEELNEERCFIVQELRVKETNQRVVRIEVGYVAKTGKPAALITLPLGISLQHGMLLQVDEGEESRYAFTRCVPGGCIAAVALTDAQIGALKAGSTAHVQFHDGLAREVNLDMSLSGFTAAFSSMQN